MLRTIFVFLLLSVPLTSMAHNKVVVVPLAGGDSKVPSFRIVSIDDDPPIAGRGRLEYTSDSKPSGTSLWGKVCDDCFQGDNSCPTPTTPKTHSAAQAVCKDLGFDSGLVDVNDTTALTSSNFFSLDDVSCPDGAQSFSQCTFSTAENCSAGEEVFIECFTTAKAPELRFSGFTWSCATGLVGSFPALPASQFFDIDDTDPLKPVLIAAAFGAGEMRQAFDDLGDVLEIVINDEVPGKSHGYSSETFPMTCPANIVVATEAFEFEVTGKGSGLIWLVSGGWFVANNVFNFNELVFKLKTPQ